jgi:hypothetical protein
VLDVKWLLSSSSARFAVVAVVPACLVACSALIDLNGLAGTGADASVADSSTDAAASSDAALDASTNADSGMTADGGTSSESGADADASFVDDFGRADGMLIGNGWVQKYPPAFELSMGRVERLFPDATHDFPDNIVYRPVEESLLDVSVAADLYIAASPPGYPQIHARIQPSSVTAAGQLDSYMFFLNDSLSEADIARQHGGSGGYATLGAVALSPALAVNTRYRMILTVVGTSPVAITGVIQDVSGAMPVAVGSATVMDTASSKISTAGTVGFAGGRPEVNGNYFYDHFVRESR